MVRAKIDDGCRLAISRRFPKPSVNQYVVDLSRYLVRAGVCVPFVRLFFEESVGDGESLHRSPLFHPLPSCVHLVKSMLSDRVVVIVFGCAAYSCVDVGSHHKVHLVVCRFLVDGCYGVVHGLDVVVAVATVWKVCCEKSELEFASAYVGICDSFVDWLELFEMLSPSSVGYYCDSSGVLVVS